MSNQRRENQPSPKVSVIVAVLNSSKTIEQCLQSVISQNYPDYELIVIDGESTDGTLEIINSFSEQIHSFSSQKDTGVYEAFNRGISKSTGDWICFLGADDFFWSSHVLNDLVSNTNKLPSNTLVAYGKVALLDEEDQTECLAGEPWSIASKKFREGMSIPHVGLLHKRSLFELHGNFNESFKIAGDYELLLRELISGEAFFVEDIIVAGHRTGGLSTNPQNGLRTHLEVRRAQKLNGILLPSPKWLWQLGKVSSRPLLRRILGVERGDIVHSALKKQKNKSR